VLPELVVFDNDGVLVDSEPLANQVLAGLLTEYGYPVTRDEAVRRFMGSTMARVRTRVEAAMERPLPADLEQRYHDELFAGFRSGLQPVPGVAEVLDGLERAGVPFCVASSGTHERIRLALSMVGLLDRFDDGRIFSADDVVHGKPAPDLFLLVAAKLGVAPERAVVVEDSPTGVVAARAAGMIVVGYAAMTPEERLVEAGADAVVITMVDLPGVLGSFGSRRPAD
jgi:HAD superfamily hydrolase (TIGR01509 family)